MTQRLLGVANLEAGAQGRHRAGKLVHGEQRHAVRGAIAKTELRLCNANLVGQRPSPRHDHNGALARRDDIEPGRQLAGAHHAATELHHNRTGLRRNAGLTDSARQGLAAHSRQLRLRQRTISTPTAPGSLSSFSIFTLTEAARGWARQRVAISSAKVSTRLMWSCARMSLMVAIIMS